MFDRVLNTLSSSHMKVLYKEYILKAFTKFSGKHLSQNLFLESCRPTFNFIKKETLAQVFSCKFCKTFKNNFFIEHLWWFQLSSGYLQTLFQLKIEILNSKISQRLRTQLNIYDGSSSQKQLSFQQFIFSQRSSIKDV